MSIIIKKFFTRLERDNMNKIIKIMSLKFPKIESNILYKIYKTSIGIRQSNVSIFGNELENIICDILDSNGIKYKRQVSINKDGYISNGKKSKYVCDIIIGNPINKEHISNYTLISAKISCRERWTQDNWTLINKPKKYILATLKSDYPPSDKFNESNTRKIVTLNTKIRDGRFYKLSYDDLINEIID